jgi:hypothetical protein
MDWEAEAPANAATIDQLGLMDRVFRVTSASPDLT